MSAYLVLARKYRPKTFDEVIGQEAVTRVLTGAIEEGRVGHAYLFAGPRGTGKTTTARILARALNCEQGPTPNPCGTCERCVAADEGSEVDVIELDAASHTGVDTIRELRDEVVYAPMRARHKVYIVDEVHMLSKAAFNALLKTLEEPPPHVVFLFATTEPHKVLDTILSRCQVLRLASLSEERIAARLVEVFRLEGVTPGEGVVEELARMARGGMRDALSLADKLLALAGSSPSLEDLLRLGGESGARQIEALLAALEAGDRAGCLTLLAEVRGDEEALAAGLLDALRTALVLHHCGAKAPFVNAGERERAQAAERVQRLGPERVELWLAELLRARERMRQLPDQGTLVLEATLLDLCREENTLPLAELVARLEALESRLASGAVAGDAPPAGAAPSPPAPRPAPSAPPASTSSAPTASAKPTGGAGVTESWPACLDELRGTHGALADALEGAGVPRIEEHEGGRVVVRLGALGAREERLVRDRRNRAALSRALSRVTGRSLTVELEPSAGGASAAPGAPAPVVEARPSPAKREPATREPPKRAPEGEPPTKPPGSTENTRPPERDAFTEKVSDLFGGVIEENP